MRAHQDEVIWSSHQRRLFVRPVCRWADTSTANPINPQGTAGGGNVFTAYPLFGNVYSSPAGSSYGNNPADATNKDTAALGDAGSSDGNKLPQVGSAGTTAAATLGAASSFFTANKTLLLTAAGGLGILFLAGLVFKLTRKNK